MQTFEIVGQPATASGVISDGTTNFAKGTVQASLNSSTNHIVTLSH